MPAAAPPGASATSLSDEHASGSGFARLVCLEAGLLKTGFESTKALGHSYFLSQRTAVAGLARFFCSAFRETPSLLLSVEFSLD